MQFVYTKLSLFVASLSGRVLVSFPDPPPSLSIQAEIEQLNRDRPVFPSQVYGTTAAETRASPLPNSRWGKGKEEDWCSLSPIIGTVTTTTRPSLIPRAPLPSFSCTVCRKTGRVLASLVPRPSMRSVVCVTK